MLMCCGNPPTMSVEFCIPGVIVGIECMECSEWASACAATEYKARELAAKRFVIVQRKLELRRRKDLRAAREVERIKSLEEVAKVARLVVDNHFSGTTATGRDSGDDLRTLFELLDKSIRDADGVEIADKN